MRLAAALPDVLGADSVLARTSPDQLMVLTLGSGAETHARRLLPRLRQAAQGLAPAMGEALQIGLALAPQDGDSPQMLMLRAGSENGARRAQGCDSTDEAGPDMPGEAVPAT